MEDLASSIAGVLGVEFSESDRYTGATLWAEADNYGIGIVDVDFPPPFESFGFLLDFGTDNEEDEYRYAKASFEKLKELSMPMVLFANGVDIELERFIPPAS